MYQGRDPSPRIPCGQKYVRLSIACLSITENVKIVRLHLIHSDRSSVDYWQSIPRLLAYIFMSNTSMLYPGLGHSYVFEKLIANTFDNQFPKLEMLCNSACVQISQRFLRISTWSTSQVVFNFPSGLCNYKGDHAPGLSFVLENCFAHDPCLVV